MTCPPGRSGSEDHLRRRADPVRDDVRAQHGRHPHRCASYGRCTSVVTQAPTKREASVEPVRRSRLIPCCCRWIVALTTLAVPGRAGAGRLPGIPGYDPAHQPALALPGDRGGCQAGPSWRRCTSVPLVFLFAIPIGVGTAVFLEEFAPGRWYNRAHRDEHRQPRGRAVDRLRHPRPGLSSCAALGLRPARCWPAR